MNFAMTCGIKSLLALFLIAGIAGCDSPASAPAAPEPPKLKVGGEQYAEGFKIHNNDSFAWKNCTFYINLKVFDGGYEATAEEVAAGGVVLLPMREFANSDGERFNPDTHIVKTFSVNCDTPTGRAWN
jgi:hypothetical protein